MATRPFPSFLIYIDGAGEYRWHYQASNTKIIADSGEGYKRREDCERGIEIMQQSANAEVWETQAVTDRRR
ncbi:MAG: DUF1508 domain-containing protein [Phenylobacterium sp.]|uniref:YegP family protein n=1 Tax=Phenylobacterium sp. TaxID=1871053 RepID=UPI001202872B|nr:DUF1508 domain-containing protein [Phenylobacterium sp.]TAL37380.1 MAG: DUF1508 domain-containing protein [Phenylobacterium sp.]